MATIRRWLGQETTPLALTDDAQKRAIWREMRDLERRIEVVDGRVDAEMAAHVKRLH